MSAYSRTVQYYETDMMGITHHSNYVRIMEEARIAMMDGMGYSYKQLEQQGVLCPVTAIQCKYLAPTTFGDRITVETRIESFNGVVLTVSYTMCKDDGTRVLTAASEHTFLDRNGHFVRLKRDYPAFCQLLMDQLEKPDSPQEQA